MSNAKHEIPEPRRLCGKTNGSAVCRLTEGHERLSPHQFERPEVQSAEYMPHGPAQRPVCYIEFDQRKRLSPEVAGRVAYDEFQRMQAAELSASVRQNATSKKPFPTGGRVTWDMLNKSTQDVWTAVARAVLEAHGQ